MRFVQQIRDGPIRFSGRTRQRFGNHARASFATKLRDTHRRDDRRRETKRPRDLRVPQRPRITHRTLCDANRTGSFFSYHHPRNGLRFVVLESRIELRIIQLVIHLRTHFDERRRLVWILRFVKATRTFRRCPTLETLQLTKSVT